MKSLKLMLPAQNNKSLKCTLPAQDYELKSILLAQDQIKKHILHPIAFLSASRRRVIMRVIVKYHPHLFSPLLMLL